MKAVLLLFLVVLHSNCEAVAALLKHVPTLTPTNFDDVITAKRVPTFVLFSNSSVDGDDALIRDYERVFRSYRHLPNSLFIAKFDVGADSHREWASDEFSVESVPDLKLIRPANNKFKSYTGELDYRSMTSWISKKVRAATPQLDAPSSIQLMQDAFDLLHSLHTLAGKFYPSSTPDQRTMLAEAQTTRQRLLLTNYGVDMIASADLHIEIMTNIIDNNWKKSDVKKEVTLLTQLSKKENKPKRKKAIDDKLEIYSSYVSTIPKIVHFIKTDSRRENFQLVHFLAVRSAEYWIKPTKILFHIPEGSEEPIGEWWDRARQYVEVRYARLKYKTDSGRILKLAAHQSDFLRLDLLIEHGGIYLDWDVISTGPLDDVLSSAAVMGMEKKVVNMNEVMGVAAMMSRPNSSFMRRFRADMEREFDGDRCYACHSTGLSRRLAMIYPEEVRTINYTSWYHPGWEEEAIRSLFDPDRYSPGDTLSEGYFYGIHLFESHKNYQTWGVPAVKVDNLLNGRPTHFSEVVRPLLTDNDWKNFKKKSSR